jgi:hypothetical protein
MNILGIIFDSKHTWRPQVAHAISKAKRALHANKIIKNTFLQLNLTPYLGQIFIQFSTITRRSGFLPSCVPNKKNRVFEASGKALNYA